MSDCAWPKLVGLSPNLELRLLLHSSPWARQLSVRYGATAGAGKQLHYTIKYWSTAMASNLVFVASMSLTILVIFLCEVSGKTKNPGDYFSLCHRDDPNLNECVRKSILEAKPKLTKGIPELRIPAIEPLFISSLEAQEGGGNVKFHQRLSNLTIHGLSAFDLKECRVAPDLSRLYLDMLTPTMYFTAHYDMTGRILALPITGSGECAFNFTTVRTIAEVPLRRVQRGGEDYLQADAFKWTIDAASGHVQFDNLFNGDKQLGDSTNKFLNENWKDAFQTYKHLPEEAFGAIFKDIGNHVFNVFPVDALFPK